MAKLNSTTITGNLTVDRSIASDGSAIGNQYISSMEYEKPVISTVDSTVYVEPDGTKWAHVFHHNNPGGNKYFASTDTFTAVNQQTAAVYKDADRWFDIAKIANQISGIWEIILVQSATSGAAKKVYRFKQMVNPMTATFNDVGAANVIKYTNSTMTYFKGSTATAIDDMRSAYGGLYKTTVDKTYLCQQNNASSNWWGATGSWTPYNSGVPGYNNEMCTSGCMDIYINIDSLYKNIKVKSYDGYRTLSIQIR